MCFDLKFKVGSKGRRSPRGTARASKSTALWLALLGSCLLTSNASAQQGVTASKFRVAPDFFPSPFERQMKFLLEGASAQPQPGGRYLVSEAQLTTFLRTGEADMIVRTPQCTYDSNRRTISSERTLLVRTADGKFSIAGEGFLWVQTNSSLVISNQVQTLVQADLLQGQRSTNIVSIEPPLSIRSEHFHFESERGVGVYDGEVKVSGTNLDLACGKLVIEVPFVGQSLTMPGFSSGPATNSSARSTAQGLRENKVRSISADQDVVVHYSGVHATGQHATYSVEKLLLNVTGQPTWRTEFREGRAEEITIDRSNRVFRAENNAYLRLWGPELRSAGLFGSLPGTGPSEVATNRQVEITSGSYEVRTNSAVFRQDVVVVDKPLDATAGDQKPGQITCGVLELEFSGTNELRRATAEGGVEITQTDAHLKGARAVFDAPAKLLSLTGSPAWQSGDRRGAGDFIQVDSEHQEMQVRGDSWLELPAQQLALGAGGSFLPGSATNQPSGGATNVARISSSQYTLGKSRAFFLGNVDVMHPQMHWTCPTLQVDLPERGGWVNRIVAEPSVSFTVVDTKGQRLQGAGNLAVYTRQATASATNSMLELTGNPASLQDTNGITVRNRVLLLDLTRNKFMVPPGYHILGPTNIVTQTNNFPPSRNRLFR